MRYVMIALGAALAGCSATKFSSPQAAQVMSQNVFNGSPRPRGDANGALTQPGSGSGQATGTITQVPTGTAAGVIPVQYVCSNNEANQNVGTSVRAASVLELKVTDPAGALVCDVKVGVKDFISRSKGVDLSACRLPGLAYAATLVDPAKPGENLFYAVVAGQNQFFQGASLSLTRADATRPWTLTSNVPPSRGFSSRMLAQAATAYAWRVGVLYADNPRNDAQVDQADCDATASPLVINLTAAGRPDPGMQLTAPERGVWFDILGEHAKPYAHAKSRISWIQNPNYVFLALPRRGAVAGVDQLFGNNTRGPDYAFADDGFAALAKYDLNGDAQIDARDAVYPRLRVWSDRNHDAVAQPDELIDLARAGLTALDLDYDASYFDEDDYGNQSRYRSTVHTADGGLHAMFDLWFAL